MPDNEDKVFKRRKVRTIDLGLDHLELALHKLQLFMILILFASKYALDIRLLLEVSALRNVLHEVSKDI